MTSNRRFILLLAALLLIGVVIFSSAYWLQSGSDTSTGLSKYCRSEDPLAGVYNPTRLKVMASCKIASGDVMRIMHESDGDYHINVDLDANFTDLLNTGNYDFQHGWLVIEVIPADQASVPIPEVGQHISFVGPWVYDTNHGWNEIHPVWYLEVNG